MTSNTGVSGGELLLEAGAFPGLATQEVKLGAAHVRVALDYHFFQARRAHQKGALHPHAIAGDASHGEVGIVAAVAGADHHPFELLGTLAVAFLDTNEHLDHVARTNLGYKG